MNESQLKQAAIREVESAIKPDGPADPRVVHCEAESGWSEDLLRQLSEHKLHVLARGADIVVYFNRRGEEIGWRDDGRKGAERPAEIDPQSLRNVVIHELGLPETCRVTDVTARELPPLGWTHEAIIVLDPVPQPDRVVRVWVDPKDLRVIQCLFGAVASTRRAP